MPVNAIGKGLDFSHSAVKIGPKSQDYDKSIFAFDLDLDGSASSSGTVA